jgi:hypothetical protein
MRVEPVPTREPTIKSKPTNTTNPNHKPSISQTTSKPQPIKPTALPVSLAAPKQSLAPNRLAGKKKKKKKT